MVHVIEGTLPVPPQWEARVARYRAEMKSISKDLVKYGIAKPGQIWTDEHYFPRLGLTQNPAIEAAEQEVHDYGEAAPVGIRKGTLPKKRVYETLEQAEHSGALMNPDWDPALTLENHLRLRLKSIQLEKGIHEFRDLGLVQPEWRDKPLGWETVNEHPDIAKFGSPERLNQGASFPKAIAHMIRDLTYRKAVPNADVMLSSPFKWYSKIQAGLNWLTLKFETAFWLYHTWVNMLPNELATIVGLAKSPLHAVKALLTYPKKCLPSMAATARNYLLKMLRGEVSSQRRKRVFRRDLASKVPEHRMIQPWCRSCGRRPCEYRMKRIFDLWERGMENATSRPLYQSFAPRMENATYKALQAAGVPEPDAAIRTRQTSGEPEACPPLTKTSQRRHFSSRAGGCQRCGCGCGFSERCLRFTRGRSTRRERTISHAARTIPGPPSA